MNGLHHSRLARLSGLRDDCAAAHKHEQATVLISACIGEGIDTKAKIIRTLVLLGFKGSHAANLLKYGTGTCPTGNYWWLDKSGSYRVHGWPPETAAGDAEQVGR